MITHELVSQQELSQTRLLKLKKKMVMMRDVLMMLIDHIQDMLTVLYMW